MIIYTIGHSTHPEEYFLQLLQEYGVNCVVDVRSVAASRFNPQYNQRRLSGYLKEKGIIYLHFPREFGARQTDPGFLDENGKVDFEKFRASPNFREGIGRLRAGVDKGYVIALMCSESDPVECHRFSMITPGLKAAGFDVWHILKDATLKSTPDLEQQLLKKYAARLSKPDMFGQPEDQLNAAYRLRNRDIGWSPDTSAAG